MNIPETILRVLPDGPLMLVVTAWILELQQSKGSSERLELFASSVLLIIASLALWNAVAGPEDLWRNWPSHALLAAIVIVFAALLGVLGKGIPAGPAVVHRTGRYLAGIGFSGALIALIVGQYAPIAW